MGETWLSTTTRHHETMWIWTVGDWFSCAFISKKLYCRTTKWWLYLSTLTTQRRGEIQERETDWWSAFLWLFSGWTDGQEHLTFLACQAGKHALAWQHRCICDERLHEIEYAQVSNGGVRCCWFATYEVLAPSLNFILASQGVKRLKTLTKYIQENINIYFHNKLI